MSQILGRITPGADALKVIQQSLLRSIALGMGRLFDPPKSAGKDTMSLRALAERIRDTGQNESLANAIDQFFLDNEDVCSRLKDVRNWYLAHLDAEMYLGNVDLPSLSHIDLDSLFDSIDSLLNTLASEFSGSFTLHGDIGMPNGDGGTLVNCLEKGGQYFDLMSDINSNLVGSATILPKILRDHGMPDTAKCVERGELGGFPEWQ